MVVAGLAIRLAGSLWAAQFLGPLLFHMAARDPATFAAAEADHIADFAYRLKHSRLKYSRTRITTTQTPALSYRHTNSDNTRISRASTSTSNRAPS